MKKSSKPHRPAKRKKGRTAAQKAATRALVALNKAKRAGAAPAKSHSKKGGKAKGHRKPTIAKGLSSGKHRPVVLGGPHGQLRRPKRSRLSPQARFLNPFLGELAVLGNPRRRHHAMKHRKSIMLRNPIKGSIAAITEGPKSMMKMDFIKDAVSVAAGFVLPNMVITKLPAWARDQHWKVYASKVVVVSMLAGVSGIVSKRVQKAILLGGGISIIMDLYADFILPRLSPAPAVPAPAATSTYFGTDGLSTYYGGHEVGDMELGGAYSLADTY